MSLRADVGSTSVPIDSAQAFALLQGADPVDALREFIEGTLAAFSASSPVPYTPTDGPLDGLSRIGQGFTATGLRVGSAFILTPLGFFEVASAFIEGDTARMLAAIENIVDGPLWAVDPAFYGLRDALPAPLGGPGGAIENFRNQIWLATEEINAAIADPAGVLQNFIDGTLLAAQQPGPVPYAPVGGPIDGFARIAQGVVATGLRLAQSAVLTPIGVLQLAAAVAQGDTDQALDIIENIVDGPLWVADPALYGLRDALPAPFGGADALVENLRNSAWAVTQQINAVIRGAVQPQEAETFQTTGGENLGNDTSAENSITSIPNGRTLTVTVRDDDQGQLDSAPATTPTASGQEPSKNLTPPAAQANSGEQTGPAPTQNVVRSSPNFTPSKNQKGTGSPDANSGGGVGPQTPSTENIAAPDGGEGATQNGNLGDSPKDDPGTPSGEE
ncbi:hypothetical protein BHQ18_23230 [Mycolicibacterium flavescens]|uniref:Uncharacterized protein n=1 Tax=Mycolicibacterium flavescens TaxID=1776 RepID=A0A1E3RCB1_MYCFV|nr:hypothetical protein BHQ18_23230 [Mycolicibacterium flavescens]